MPTSTVKQRRSAAEMREHLLAVASELFYREGIRATGVDRVAAAAGVAPPTLYRIFPAKDDLIAAYVERCSAAYKKQLTAASAAGTPRQRILAVFDVFLDEALSESCRGCPFLMVIAEFPDAQHPAHRAAVGHKTWVRELLGKLVRDLATQTHVSDPEALAEQLSLLAEGIYGSVQVLGPAGPARQGRACAEALLGAATRR